MTATLDTLAFDADGVTLVGEYDLPIRHCLIARQEMPLDRIEAVISHPQPSAQCARFIRENLPQAEVRAAPSTAEAVRTVAESEQPWAALGAESAAELYGAAVLRQGVEDEPDNITRFVWVAPEGTVPSGSGPWRTSLVFSELGEDHPGALVDALQVFSGPRDQPEPDRVAAAASGPRPLPVLPRRGGSRCGRAADGRHRHASLQGRERARPGQLADLGATRSSRNRVGAALQSRPIWATGPPHSGLRSTAMRPP